MPEQRNTRVPAAEREKWIAEVFESYKRDVYQYVMSMLRDTHAAEDITQDVFLNVFRFAEQYHGKASLRTWIFAIARNAIADYWRKNHMEGPYHSDVLPDQAVTMDLGESDFYEILGLLDKPSRDTVSMHLTGGLKHREIAAITGETEAAVKKRYSRALKQLRRYYEKG